MPICPVHEHDYHGGCEACRVAFNLRAGALSLQPESVRLKAMGAAGVILAESLSRFVAGQTPRTGVTK